MGTSTRFQFNPTVVKGNLDGASQTLPTGSGQMLYYEVTDGASSPNSLGYTGFMGGGKVVGIIAYDFLQTRWACLFSENGILSTHQNTTWVDDIGQIKAFIATLVSPPVPITDLAGDDVPWPASFPPVGVS